MQYYSFTQLFQKYNLSYGNSNRLNGTTEAKIKHLERCGIIIKEAKTEFSRKKMFEIVDDSLFTSDWVAHPTLPLELTKEGKVRNKNTKTIY